MSLRQEATHSMHIMAPKGLAFPKWICGNKGSRIPKRPKTMLPHFAEPRETWPEAFSLNSFVFLSQVSRTCPCQSRDEGFIEERASLGQHHAGIMRVLITILSVFQILTSSLTQLTHFLLIIYLTQPSPAPIPAALVDWALSTDLSHPGTC